MDIACEYCGIPLVIDGEIIRDLFTLKKTSKPFIGKTMDMCLSCYEHEGIEMTHVHGWAEEASQPAGEKI